MQIAVQASAGVHLSASQSDTLVYCIETAKEEEEEFIFRTKTKHKDE